ncbi:MAG: SDR family NAD(P)-dependent oxidoreductase [Pseudomonadales bacterium]|jgi:3-oxoacyl-[acyl-carrier protein] reductase|tara:strand:+ start:11412 stop:12146 length:735 start_codon:yes stop_codon:yes gene_type:complete
MQESFDFKGKSILVVGGSSGIGNGIAQAFRRCQAKVTVWGTRAAPEDYSAAQGSDLEGLEFRCVDVSDRNKVAAERGPEKLDVLVLCQGSVAYGREEFDVETFSRILDINLVSMMACATRFRAALEASGGSVITISSVGAYRVTVGNPAYAASKAGLVHLTGTLAKAWAPTGIRVNGVAPGLVDTKITKVTMANPKRLQERLEGIPAGRLGTPEDMAGACLFLASPLASYIYGQTIVVDGGRML